MGIDRMQKRVPRQATLITGRIVWPAVATDGVAAGIAEVGIVNAKLCMVEQIEGLTCSYEQLKMPSRLRSP
jgi:hypothetical protein